MMYLTIWFTNKSGHRNPYQGPMYFRLILGILMWKAGLKIISSMNHLEMWNEYIIIYWNNIPFVLK